MNKPVTQSSWETLKKNEEALLMEFLEADKDPGNIEVKQSFSEIEGEDFVELNASLCASVAPQFVHPIILPLAILHILFFRF